jgi:hypothetical protein
MSVPTIIAHVTLRVDGALISGHAMSDGSFQFIMSDRPGFGPSGKAQLYKNIPDAIQKWREQRPMEVA